MKPSIGRIVIYNSRNVPMLGDGETPPSASMPPNATSALPGVAYWPTRA